MKIVACLLLQTVHVLAMNIDAEEVPVSLKIGCATLWTIAVTNLMKLWRFAIHIPSIGFDYYSSSNYYYYYIIRMD
jgi:hypothetical protein